jgi:glycosyltransferase involved in cell wall biosynthesis
LPEVIVCDNFSSDNTPSIAQSFSNVRFIQTEFTGMGNVRNFAASVAQYDWVFFVDSDEVVAPQLVTTLLNMRFTPGTAYKILRHNYYAGKLVTTSSWGNDWVTRIYNKTETSYTPLQVHESVITEGLACKEIDSGTIFHFPYEEVSQLVAKTQAYSDWYAQQNRQRKNPKLVTLPFRMLFMFLKCYLLKGGFRDGYEGLVVSMFNAIGVWTKYIKLYEQIHRKTIVLDLTIESEAELSTLAQLINQQTLLPELVIFRLAAYSTQLVNKLSTALSGQLVIEHLIFNASTDNLTQLLTIQLEKSAEEILVITTQAAQLTNQHFMAKQRKKLGGI